MRAAPLLLLALSLAAPAAAADNPPPACAPPVLSPDDAHALLGFLEHAPLQGGDAPRFMAVVAKLRDLAGIKPPPPPPRQH